MQKHLVSCRIMAYQVECQLGISHVMYVCCVCQMFHKIANLCGMFVRCNSNMCCVLKPLQIGWRIYVAFPSVFLFPGLNGRTRAIVIAESQARVIAAIRIMGGHISLQNTAVSPYRPCVRCAAIQIARFVQHSFHVELRNGRRELITLAEH